MRYMIFKNLKQLILGAVVIMTLFASCNREVTVGRVLFKESKNKIYKDVDEAQLSEAIGNVLKSDGDKLKSTKFLTAFYQENGNQAVLITKFYPDGKLTLLSERLANVSEHGLDPTRFNSNEYQELLTKINSKDGITTLEDAYQQIARLELATADAILNYSSALQFGVVNPNKVLKRYYIETKQADEEFMKGVLSAGSIETLLDSIQPKSDHYLALQNALKSGAKPENLSAEDARKTIIVNMERARWKQDVDSNNMIYVNIPAFRLDVVKDGKVTGEMKVVVGTGRNNSGKATFTNAKKIKDTPHSHETPVLESMIHSVQVNPYWNIPKSIAGKEILKLVQADRYYLSNAGIDVLQNEKIVEDPENIDWASLSPDNLPYRFRQRPGDENSLGKIKFLFKNNSSVYLHDTPAQAAFNRDVRASSHGCVRVEQPLDLANALFKEDKFTTIKNDMESAEQKPARDVALSPKTQVVLDYKTVEVKDNKLKFYPDVYEQDIVLYSHM